MDIIERFARLPPWIDVDGVHFELMLIIDGSALDMRLVYNLSYASEGSKHYIEWEVSGSWSNPFYDDNCQGFLFMVEGIKDQWTLSSAIDRCEIFLLDNNLNNIQ